MQIIENTIHFVKETLRNSESGHDWFHVERVYKNALEIAKTHKCNILVVQLAALLHDIADSKFHDGDETIGSKTAKFYLENQNLDPQSIDHIIAIIDNISFKGGKKEKTHTSIELDIVQDADRLDAMGAIGIARCFNYGGYKNRTIYDPVIHPNLNQTKEAYKNSSAPSINHFYEKLLLLKNLMNTPKGKQLAEKRHDFMILYLEHFFEEIGKQPFLEKSLTQTKKT